MEHEWRADVNECDNIKEYPACATSLFFLGTLSEVQGSFAGEEGLSSTIVYAKSSSK